MFAVRLIARSKSAGIKIFIEMISCDMIQSGLLIVRGINVSGGDS